MLYKYKKIHNDLKLAEIAEQINCCGAGKVDSFEGWRVFTDRFGKVERLIKQFKARQMEILEEKKNQGL